MKTARHVPGAPCWAELCTPDTAAAHAFYSDLFNWDTALADAPPGAYVLLTMRDELIGGMKLAESEPSATWEIYFTSKDLASTGNAVEAAGGSVVSPPTKVFDRGSAAYYLAPDGGGFGAWQPDRHAGVSVMREPGALSWFELSTPDTERAVSFYTDVFDWTLTRHAFGGSSYIDLETRGGAVPFGGIMPLEADGIPIQWTPYFTAHSADATADRALDLGGSVISAPKTLANIGRISMLRDPQGAAFSVISRPGGGWTTA
jgi:predicted enzyme related to lactoylglutathione lyase